MKKIFILTFIILSLFVSIKTEASFLLLNTNKNDIGLEEEFYVDVLLDPEAQSINGISGEVFFDEKYLEFKRFEDSKSMVNLWIDKPNYFNGKIYFSGLITGGFDGVIDPFNTKNKLPGIILRLVFVGKISGISDLGIKNSFITLNDGIGTEILLDDHYISISLNENINEKKLEYKYSIPEINAEIIQDENLYGGKYTLIFSASDEESGIKEVLIKEGFRKWEKVENPYLLKDQSRHDKIIIKAINHQGESNIFVFDSSPYKVYEIIIISIIIIIMIFVYTFLRKIYVVKK